MTKRSRILASTATVCTLTIIGLECVSRFVLGLGTPPLTVSDPEIEYQFAPDQNVTRFGRRIRTNSSGMRSDDTTPEKTDPLELRVLVLGDSVINGGSLTDHDDLATTILQNELRQNLRRPAWVGNASAGSWGPQNQLAWWVRFGHHDADVVVLQVSAHDLADVPTFEPLNERTHPSRRPWSATTEGISRYLPKYIPRIFPGTPDSTPEGDSARKPWQTAEGMEDLAHGPAVTAMRALLSEASATGAAVQVLYHPERHETFSGPNALARRFIEELAEAAGSRIVRSRPLVDDERQTNETAGLYRDDIHPNPTGQVVLAQRMLAAIEKDLKLPTENASPASGRSARHPLEEFKEQRSSPEP